VAASSVIGRFAMPGSLVQMVHWQSRCTKTVLARQRAGMAPGVDDGRIAIAPGQQLKAGYIAVNASSILLTWPLVISTLRGEKNLARLCVRAQYPPASVGD
jgi:hypothetical protein